MAAQIPKMKLWYHPMLRSTRPAWLIKELGIEDKVEFKYLWLDLGAPGPEREEYRKTVHPHSTIPALEIEGRPNMLESAAMCMYLADLCGRLAPEPKNRSEYYDWIMYAAMRLDENMELLSQHWWLMPKEKENPEVTAQAKARCDLCFDRLENTLKDRPYILGQELTAADCVLGYDVLWAADPNMKNGVFLEGRPNVQAYLKRIMARPALQATLAMPGEYSLKDYTRK
ncbi:glutathione S-transferase GstA-like isoform X2 [Littorina saxatilis]